MSAHDSDTVERSSAISPKKMVNPMTENSSRHLQNFPKKEKWNSFNRKVPLAGNNLQLVFQLFH